MKRSARVVFPILGCVSLAWYCGGPPAGPDATPQPPSPPPPAVPPSAATVEVAPNSVVFTSLGDTETLAATVRSQDGAVLPSASVTWASSDPAVASVEAGTVTARSNGEASVTATSGGASGSAAVRVEQVAARLNVVPRDVRFPAIGDTARLSAAVYDGNDHEVAGATVGWTSTYPDVATVSDGGLVTAISDGTAEIVAASGAAMDTVAVNVDSTDRGILAAFYHAAGGPSWRHSDNWLTDAPLSEWYGVEARADDRVTGLELRENGAVGSLAPEIGRLSYIETLDLYENKLTGRLPPELGNATRLREIDLGHNQFRGPIPPELGRLRSLRSLNLEYMWLSGSIPAEIGALPELRFLNVFSNTLTGRVPPELSDLRNLSTLRLADNRLTGSIPSTFTRLENLSTFYWDHNDGLCAPGTESFEAWRRSRSAEGPRCDAADRATLEYLFENLGGEGWNRATGWLGEGLLSRWYGIDTDSLGRVEVLDLSDNGLEGRLPDRIGELTSMTALRVDGNRSLHGPIPQSLTALMLREFRYGGTDLCVPGASTFQAWLGAIPDRQGPDDPCPALSDREVLAMLYEATGGSAWTDNTNWLSDAPLRDWYGVETNGDGAVTELVLYGNNLRGRIPPEIGQLEALTILDFDYNWLRGPVPAALADLERLRILSLHSNLLEGSIPPELGTLRALEVLKLSDNQLTGRIPPMLGELTSLFELWLRTNRLEGPIPPELGDLRNLEDLRLSANRLEGPIPPELGRLEPLQVLWLDESRLTGPIPPELGNLSNVAFMYLGFNELSGGIPPELGNLRGVWELALDANELTGRIPPELGSLTDTGGELNLRLNKLTGPIPAELGNLESLAKLRLGHNNLEGRVPPELGRMRNLEWLDLAHNPRLSGPLPTTFADLGRLGRFEWTGTGLCVPEDPVLLDRSSRWRMPRCDRKALTGSQAYLTQAVQSLEFPVPLIEGKAALLRAFVIAPRPTGAEIPDVRATFFYGEEEIHAIDIPGKSTPLPIDLAEAEASLEKSANADIPGWVVRPGVELEIEVDPAGTLDPGLGVSPRIPESGRLRLPVERMPTFGLTVVPFLWRTQPDSTAIDLAAEMAANPEGHRLLWETIDLLPVDDLSVEAHEPVLTSSNDSDALLDEVGAVRVMEGGRGYYMAALSGEATGAWGVAWIPGWTSYVRLGVSSQPEEALTIAHELGHNLSLFHAPCDVGATLDPAYPFSDGSTGAWGIDSRSGEAVLVPATTADFMSYCVPAWIGDYHFGKAAAYRTVAAAFDAPAPPTATMLLWGGAEADGTPYLNPAFAVDAPPALPTSDGEHEIVGRAADGRILFSLSFDMTPVADSEGRLGFAYAVPVQGEMVALLEEITLSGPGGAITMDRDTNEPAVILRDRMSGQVRGLLRDLPQSVRTLADAVTELGVGPDVDVLFSRGIPPSDRKP